MGNPEEARTAVEEAKQLLRGGRTDEAAAHALVAIAMQLDRIAGKIG